ncbi:hypothetical protein HYY75_07125 [bacterium]|nr:hypothetical protein [bacterium]
MKNFDSGNPVPRHGFCGSANISYTSDQTYAENRVFFYDRPDVLRQLQEEFARLWNEYAVSIFGPCMSEKFIPVNPPKNDVQIFFNGEPVDELQLTRLDDVIADLIQRVSSRGSLDLAMFSLTNSALANLILETAKSKPNANFRILLDLSQLDDSDPKDCIQGPRMEREAKKLGLRNFEIRYKWRTNAFGWDTQKAKLTLVSFKNLFLHHKVLAVDGRFLAMGSYNWSSSGENLNLENLMVFDGTNFDHSPVVLGFLREFEEIWRSRRPTNPVSSPLKGIPQTVTGPEGRGLKSKILKVLGDERNLRLVQALDRGAFLTSEELGKQLGLKPSELRLRIGMLIKNKILCKVKKGERIGYMQSD